MWEVPSQAPEDLLQSKPASNCDGDLNENLRFCSEAQTRSSLPPQFIIEDMKQQQTNKHSNLHREDQHITVEELWRGWKTSEGGAHTQQSSQTMRTRPLTLCLVLSLHPVHNWTMEDTVQWLKDSVELPQYEKNFRDFRVTGNTLPRSELTSLFLICASSVVLLGPMLPSAGPQRKQHDCIYSLV